MVLYFSDNKETERKRKGVFYEETLPENAVIFGSTTLKKYNGGTGRLYEDRHEKILY